MAQPPGCRQGVAGALSFPSPSARPPSFADFARSCSFVSRAARPCRRVFAHRDARGGFLFLVAVSIRVPARRRLPLRQTTLPAYGNARHLNYSLFVLPCINGERAAKNRLETITQPSPVSIGRLRTTAALPRARAGRTPTNVSDSRQRQDRPIPWCGGRSLNNLTRASKR